MPDKSFAALKVGPSTTELREVDLPDISVDAALLKMEIAGARGPWLGAPWAGRDAAANHNSQ